MKLRNYAILLAAAFAASCSSDFDDFGANVENQNDPRMFQVGEGFALASVAEEGSRTNWKWNDDYTGLVNVYLPQYEVAGAVTAGDKLSVHADPNSIAIGLCWLGDNVDKNVRTNYMFSHYGWMKNGKSDPKIDPCTGVFADGYRYEDIELAAVTKVAGADVDIANDFQTPAAGAGINFNTGVYKTENKAIFKGDYIVYYPYNEKFNEIGTIPAVAETEVTGTQNLEDPALGKNTFRYGTAMGIDGGAKAKGFGFHNLSGLIQINLKAASNSGMNGKTVKNIILYSAEKNIVKQANLSAAAIVAGNKGQALYDSWEGTNKLNVDCGAGITLATGNNLFYVTALPANITDLKVLVRLYGDSWAEYSVPNYEVLPGAIQALTLNVASGNYNQNTIYAVDDATLRSANSTYANKTIKLIGDVKLTSDISINSKITIDGGKLIVPEGVTMTVANEATIKSPVEVQGASCCSGAVGGELVINNTKAVVNDVTLTPAETSNAETPTLTLGEGTLNADKTIDVQAGTVNVNNKFIVKGNFVVANGATMNVLSGGTFNVVGGTLTNNGTIEVVAGGSFAMLDASGSTTYQAGQNMINNGTFIHNVSAGVGGATQYMQQNSKYICRVNSQDRLNDAYAQWTACSIIEIIGGTTYNLIKATTSDKLHNGKYVDIYVSASNITFEQDFDEKTIEIGNLKVDGANLQISLIKNGVTGYTSSGTAIYGNRYRNLTVHGNITANKDVTVNNIGTLTVTGNVTVKDNMTLSQSTAIVVNGNIIVDKSGKTLTYNSGNGKLQVAGNIQLKSGGNFIAGTNAKNITANNFIVTKGIATFYNRSSADIITMDIANEIKVEKDGTFTIATATSGMNIARITCRKLTEAGSFGTEYRPVVVM